MSALSLLGASEGLIVAFTVLKLSRTCGINDMWNTVVWSKIIFKGLFEKIIHSMRQRGYKANPCQSTGNPIQDRQYKRFLNEDFELNARMSGVHISSDKLYMKFCNYGNHKDCLPPLIGR